MSYYKVLLLSHRLMCCTCYYQYQMVVVVTNTTTSTSTAPPTIKTTLSHICICINRCRILIFTLLDFYLFIYLNSIFYFIFHQTSLDVECLSSKVPEEGRRPYLQRLPLLNQTNLYNCSTVVRIVLPGVLVLALLPLLLQQ